MNQVLYTLVRHPREHTLDLSALEQQSAAGKQAAEWLRDSRGPVARRGQGLDNRLDLNCGPATVKGLKALAKATNDAELRRFVDSLDGFLTPAWKDLASIRGRRHHWLTGHVTPGLLNFPATQPHGSVLDTDGGVTYLLQDPSLHDPVAESSAALDEAVDAGAAVMCEIGDQLCSFAAAWNRCFDYVSDPPHTMPGSAQSVTPSANGECFPYQIRFWLKDRSQHRDLTLRWFSDPDRPPATPSSFDDVRDETGFLHTTICSTDFATATNTLVSWISDGTTELAGSERNRILVRRSPADRFASAPLATTAAPTTAKPRPTKATRRRA